MVKQIFGRVGNCLPWSWHCWDPSANLIPYPIEFDFAYVRFSLCDPLTNLVLGLWLIYGELLEFSIYVSIYIFFNIIYFKIT